MLIPFSLLKVRKKAQSKEKSTRKYSSLHIEGVIFIIVNKFASIPLKK